MYDVIIFGGGPAGLTAALYAKRGGLKTAVIEKSAIGGQTNLAGEIENYPGVIGKVGYEISESIYSQCKSSGVDFIFGEPKAISLSEEIKSVAISDKVIESKFAIIASGARARNLDLAKEVEYVGKGVSYCAHCDGNFFKKKTVAVIGGGDTALTDALYLSNICEMVYLIHRRNEFRGSLTYVERLKARQNVSFVLGAVPKDICGDGKVESLLISKNGEEENLPVSAVFVAVGTIPNSEEFNVNKNQSGFIVTDKNMRTSVNGVYAVGDVRESPLRQIVTACADGAVAANDIIPLIVD